MLGWYQKRPDFIAYTNLFFMNLEPSLEPFLEPYLPRQNNNTSSSNADQDSKNQQSSRRPETSTSSPELPFITLTWAQSLDGRIAAAPGTQTKISGPETKVMTHYQRSRHDAILVGAGTATTDDPKLNCRFPEVGAHFIRPVVVDPRHRWRYSSSTARKVYKQGAGLAPFVVVSESVALDPEEVDIMEKDGGQFVPLSLGNDLVANWKLIFGALHRLGISSVMVEGGAFVIESLLASALADSMVITIGSTILGRDGVAVSPPVSLQLQDVSWWKGRHDSVMAARPKRP
ncbi:hypothetical_protein [Candidozyma auris]|uniref:2,5-diamino-6-(ribosylamino)-4(3H)-pyrimidinone 5'-phosphate reductase n=1 Tax=Candidozyma auris TaxID=498019 RepID=UPI0012559122|nr:2,5-diamino-6-(ribosylamino)-4(3H)-pyrimidinone 5'-phosphate reductase [[Candida] auris]QEO21690.1 hypothetical_protein [[Candida] auris]